jgi:peptide/nickel transport system substrate-binding protein
MTRKVPIILVLFLAMLLAPALALAGARDNSLITAETSKISTLDLYDTSLRILIIMYNEISDPLVGRNPTTMELDPAWGLAESWKVIDDVTLEFKLRSGIKHHTGNPLTSEDFRWLIMDRMLPEDMKSPQRTNVKWIKEVQVIDPLTFRIVANEPYAPGLMRLNTVFAVDSKYIKEKGLAYFAEHPVGTGPFKFVKWEKGSRIEFEKNPDYWRPQYPKTDKMIWRIIPERSTQLAELLKGDIDFIRTVPPDQAPVIEASPKAKVAATPLLRIEFYIFDAYNRSGKKSPVQNLKVRQAIAHAIDIDSILKNVLLGYAQRIQTPLNPWHFGYDPSIEWPYAYDPEKAKQLLAEANYPKDYEMDLWIYADPDMNQVVQNMLGKVGIKVKLHDYTVNSGELTRLRRAGRVTDMAQFNWGSYNVFDADAMLYTWFHSSSTSSYANTPEIDKLLDEARTTMDPAKRKTMYSKVQRWAVDNAVVIPTHARYEIYGVAKNLHFEPVGDEVPRFYRIYWEK